MPGKVGKSAKAERASDLTKSTASAVQAEMRNKQEAARLQLCTRMLERHKAHTRRVFDKDRRDVMSFMRATRRSSGMSGEGVALSGPNDRDFADTDYARHSMSRKRLSMWRSAEAKIQKLIGPAWMRSEPEVDGVDRSEAKLRVVMGMMGFSDAEADQVVQHVERETQAQEQPQLDRRAIYLRNRKCKHLLDMDLKHFRSREDVFAKLRTPEMEPPKPKSAFPPKEKPDPLQVREFPLDKWQSLLFDEYTRTVTSLSDSMTSLDRGRPDVRRAQSASVLSRSNQDVDLAASHYDVTQIPAPISLNIPDMRRKATSVTSLRSNASSSHAPADDVNANNCNVRRRASTAKLTSQSRAQSQPVIRVTDVSDDDNDDVTKPQQQLQQQQQQQQQMLKTEFKAGSKRLSFADDSSSLRMTSPTQSHNALSQLRRHSEMLPTRSVRHDIISETGSDAKSRLNHAQLRRASLPASVLRQRVTSRAEDDDVFEEEGDEGESALMPRWKRKLLRDAPDLALRTHQPRAIALSREKRQQALDAMTSSHERDVSRICAVERERRASKVEALMAVVKIRELMTSRPMRSQRENEERQ